MDLNSLENLSMRFFESNIEGHLFKLRKIFKELRNWICFSHDTYVSYFVVRISLHIRFILWNVIMNEKKLQKQVPELVQNWELFSRTRKIVCSQTFHF